MRFSVRLTVLTLVLASRGSALAAEAPASAAQPGHAPEAREAAKTGSAGVLNAKVDEPALKVGVGQLKVITVPGVQRVTVGDPDILVAQLLEGGQIELVGAGAGQTTLVAWTSGTERLEFLVSAVHDHGVANPLLEEVRELLGDMKGVFVRQMGDRIFIDGKTYAPAEAERVAQVVAGRPEWINLTRPASEAQVALATKINRALGERGFRDLRVILTGPTFFLEGPIALEADRARAEALVKAILAAEE